MTHQAPYVALSGVFDLVLKRILFFGQTDEWTDTKRENIMVTKTAGLDGSKVWKIILPSFVRNMQSFQFHNASRNN